MVTEKIKELVVAALEDVKGVDIRVLDVRTLTNITDMMVFASGTSDRHVKSLAGNVVQQAKLAGFRPISVEGEREGEWVLVDLGEVVVHVMLPRTREFYQIEKLWSGGEIREGTLHL